MSIDVYVLLREGMFSGEFPPGVPLNEVVLAERFGTSRTPVREAIHRLEIERLVERRGRSFAVREIPAAEILDIYDVRTTLEGAAASKAATRATDLDLLRLTSGRDAMRNAATIDPRTKAELNHRFHEVLWEASHSPTLVDLLTRINSHLFLASRTTFVSAERWSAALAEHDGIVAAIREHDATRARELAESHMVAARDVRLRTYATP